MLLKHVVKEGVSENGSDEEEMPRVQRGPAASWDEVQVEPVGTEAGIILKGIVEVRAQEAAVHPTCPSSMLEVRLPRGKAKDMALGRLLVRTLVSDPDGSGWDQQGLWCWNCLADLKSTPSHPPGFWGDSHKGFPKDSWSPSWADLGKQVWVWVVSEGCCFTLHFSTLLLQDYITPEISLYSEKGLKGEQVKLTRSLQDPQSLKRPMQVASATVSAGL